MEKGFLFKSNWFGGFCLKVILYGEKLLKKHGVSFFIE